MSKVKKNKDRKRVLKIIGQVVLNAVVGILLLLGLLVGISIVPLKDNYKLLAVTSGSMEPTIQTGNLAVIKPVADYQVGDIITYQTKNTAEKSAKTTHRIISVEKQGDSTYFKTKGDANSDPDFGLVRQDQVAGKYRFSIPYLGYVLGYLKTLPGLVVFIIIPATVIIYEEIKKIHQASKKYFKKQQKNKKVKKVDRKKSEDISPKKKEKKGKKNEKRSK